MHPAQILIIDSLREVDAERTRRQSQPKLQTAVLELKRYQQQRFTRTYADLLRTQRYAAAAQFFLDELYGPTDFSQRDAQFMRVAPAIVRLFPGELVHAVAILAQLHAVSEALDSEMGMQLLEREVDAMSYIRAWQATGQPETRRLQIDLTLEIGALLDRYTRKPLLRQTLRLMRGPARAAGLAELQRFLEAGFDAFKAMNGAVEFLGFIRDRERELADALFAATPAPERDSTRSADAATALALEQLP